MTGNVLGSPRTTTAGALGVVFAIVGSQVIPALASYFVTQPGVAWQFLGMLLGAIPGALMTDVAKRVADAIDPPKPAAGFVALYFAPVLALVAMLLVAAVLVLPARARADGPLVHCFSGCSNAKLRSALVYGDVAPAPEAKLWIGPSIGLMPAVLDSATKTWETGVAPSFGYGVKWAPAGWTATPALVSGDLFVRATFTGDTRVDVLPVVTLLDGVSVGFGPRIHFATPTTGASLSWLFSIGFSTAVGGP